MRRGPWSLDFRFAVRMLVRYPVLTVSGSASLALAIAIGAAVFAFITLLLWPSLPLHEGDRIVSVRIVDVTANACEARLTADFLRFRAAARRAMAVDPIQALRAE